MINAVWHQQNVMPKSPTLPERIAWHRAHQAHCGCRPVPEKLQALISAKVPTSARSRKPSGQAVRGARARPRP